MRNKGYKFNKIVNKFRNFYYFILGGDKFMNDMKPIIHTVKPGDTLYNLATQYGTTVQKIMENNMALDIYNLRVGQRILIYPGWNQDNRECISQKQVELLKQMNLVWEQHIMWTQCF